MTTCAKVDTCPFFSGHMVHMPAVANLLKENYCLEDSSPCARLQLITAGKRVPDDLFPNDTVRAKELLHW